MAPNEYSLRLQKGIVGGFAPPTPDAVVTISKAATNPSLIVSSAVRPEGQPSLQDAAPKHLPSDHPETDALVSELHSILKELPLEEPAGSEDIYGLNTSIAWGSEDLQWCNGGPQGCGGGKSTVQPTDQEKEKFSRAVHIVNTLVAKDA